MKPGRGRFITLEGGEGTGKSTQVPRLAAALRHAGLRVHTTREPGGSIQAEAIRKLLVEGEPGTWRPIAEALLNYAARAEHVERMIRPALVAGAWVVSDRFADSTMAYQGYGHRLGRQAVEALHRLTLGAFKPDLTLILDLDARAGLERAAARGGGEDRYERMDEAFHRRLRRGFLDTARREPRRCKVIDASDSVEATGAKILAAVARRFKLRLG
ncbi:MAG: dTMP kinase [Pseudomonadota bacterium]